MKKENSGTASLVLGLLGLLFCWVPFTFIMDILALIYARGIDNGNATAGKVMGIIGLIINGIMTFIIIIALIVGMSI